MYLNAPLLEAHEARRLGVLENDVSPCISICAKKKPPPAGFWQARFVWLLLLLAEVNVAGFLEAMTI
jgi:hypothetical protein